MQMLIKGIRSFSPDNTHVIEFYKPLTLIVGHNGAGKTVRSCLRGNLCGPGDGEAAISARVEGTMRSLCTNFVYRCRPSSSA